MEALTLFQQNFAVAESLLQVHRLFEGLIQAAEEQELARRHAQSGEG